MMDIIEISFTNNIFIKYKSDIDNNIVVCDSSMCYEEIFKNHIVQNVPCLVSNVTDGWKCNLEWSHEGKPNLENMLLKYKNSTVSISTCNVSQGERIKECKKSVLFEEYIRNYYHSNSCNDIWYLKDWHLRKENPEESFYFVPKYFASDWLNEYALDNQLDDFMFVYMGPKNSWTPFHSDVYSSFSWSVNIVGRKRWILFPPGEEKKILDDMDDLPPDVVPFLESRNLKYYEVYQNSGEAIFIPSGWYHQVFNVEDTISINHNWVNGANINVMWTALINNLSMVEKEIAEYKNTDDWSNHCQVMLKALFGLHLNDFFEFIIFIAKKRLSYKTKQVTFQQWNFGENHILFDLNAIKIVLENMTQGNHYSEHQCLEISRIINDINKLNDFP